MRLCLTIAVRVSLDGKANPWRRLRPLGERVLGWAPWQVRCVTWPGWRVVEVLDRDHQVIWSWRGE